MGTIQVQSIIDEVSTLLLDVRTPRRWSDNFHYRNLCNGQRAIVRLRPDANPVDDAIEMEPGIRQQIPRARTQLIALRYNLAADGETPTRIIRHINKADLDRSYPAWPQADPATEVQFVMFDSRYPRQFDVFPPQPQGLTGIVAAVCGAVPPDPPDPATDTATKKSLITIEDAFAEALKYYMLAWARATDGSGKVNWDRARDYLTLYSQELGVSKQAELANEPKPEPKQ